MVLADGEDVDALNSDDLVAGRFLCHVHLARVVVDGLVYLRLVKLVK